MQIHREKADSWLVRPREKGQETEWDYLLGYAVSLRVLYCFYLNCGDWCKYLEHWTTYFKWVNYISIELFFQKGTVKNLKSYLVSYFLKQTK